jgi:hypothetical protein
VDHLAQQVDFSAGIFLERFITDFNSIFNAITKAEMPRQVKLNRSEIEQRWRKILLTQVL